MLVSLTSRGENVFAPELGYVTCRGCRHIVGRHERCDGVGLRTGRHDVCDAGVCQNGANRLDHAPDCPDFWASEVRSIDPQRVTEALERHREHLRAA